MIPDRRIGADVPGLDFIAIDVETANSDPGTICQVGLATFRDGRLTAGWKSLANPGCDFHHGNIAIHGIRKADVAGAMLLSDIMRNLHPALGANVLVSHSSFDRRALANASARFDLPMPDYRWIDTLSVARRAWPELKERGGYSLGKVCRFLGHDFAHHDALADAIACGHLLAIAAARTGWSIGSLITPPKPPAKRLEAASPRFPAAVRARSGDPLGHLAGEAIVFSGDLSLPREDAAGMAARAGCRVMTTVGYRTTIVVVGGDHPSMRADAEKSSKHRKAEDLAAEGYPIRIIGEGEFRSLVGGT
ncbi:DNA polymerase-3 subunit epsilon [Hoeflea marina]|uniref:DNA polymerase-3 subunit epsilon n=1 Tax=Hoeflea marina TaxID=274592 RepID=A0A317PI02_9HYPH|nr:exonuclease domain-containing protein [Hoeflea marina]PWV99973.1 DNA polymerase-3 subunit epsilon [Hoeflea marina]